MSLTVFQCVNPNFLGLDLVNMHNHMLDVEGRRVLAWFRSYRDRKC